MSKAVVYGQQVQVRLLTSDLVPLIIDWDKFDATALSTDRAYMAISKRQARHHSMGSGMKLVLSRTKKDNYLKSLIYYNQYCINKGIEPLQFVIEETVRHTYEESALNPFSELAGKQKIIKVAPNKLEQIAKLASQIAQIKQASENTASQFGINSNFLPPLSLNDPTSKIINNTIDSIHGVQKQAQDVAKNILDKIKAAAEFTKNVQKKIEDLQAQISIIMGSNNDPKPFKEVYRYIDCSMSEESWSHAVHEGTLELAVFHCSGIECYSDANQYDEDYANAVLEDSIVKRITYQYEKIKKQ